MTEEEQAEVDAFVGVQIRIARKAARMSADTLAAELGVSVQQYRKYENGLNRITPAKLFAVAEFLGVPLTQLLDRPAKLGSVPAKENNPAFYQTAVGAKLARDFQALSPENQDLALKLVGALVVRPD